MQQEVTKKTLVSLLSKYGSIRAVSQGTGMSRDRIRRLMSTFQMESPARKIDYLNVDNQNLIVNLRKEISKLPNLSIPVLHSQGTMETAVLQSADWHIGSKTVDGKGKIIYSVDIATLRIQSLCSKLIFLIKDHIFSSSKVDEIVLLVTGDMVDGEDIYPGQAYNLEEVPPKQVILFVNLFSKFILELTKFKLPIRIYCVRGNHGRTNKQNSDKSNWDIMAYLILDWWIKMNKPSKVYLEYTEGEYLNLDIKGHPYQIRHEAPAQTESPAGAAKIEGWKSMYGIEALAHGHWHHPSIVDCAGVRKFMSGSLKGVDALSDRMAKGSDPSQLIWGVSQKHISTFTYIVDLK